MVSTNQTKQAGKPEIIENNTCYRSVRLSTEHRAYGNPGIAELFAHITQGQGNITLTRISTTRNPQKFVLSDEELFKLVAHAVDFRLWQDCRNTAYKEARALLQEQNQDTTLFLDANQEDANLFNIKQAKQYLEYTTIASDIHFEQLVSATSAAIAKVQAEKVEEASLIEVELQKLKKAGFQLISQFEDEYFFEHEDFDYQPSIRRDVKEVQENTPVLLAKLEEIREHRRKTKATKASIDALKTSGFVLQTMVSGALRLTHPALLNDVWTIDARLSNAEEKAQRALECLQQARQATPQDVTIQEYHKNKQLY